MSRGGRGKGRFEEEADRVIGELVALGLVEDFGRGFRLSDWAVREILEGALDSVVKAREVGKRMNLGEALAAGCMRAYLEKRGAAKREEIRLATCALMAFIEIEMRGYDGVEK
jgi:hypothetical protein